MSQDVWITEASRYSNLPSQEREAYWQNLTTAQQEALHRGLALQGPSYEKRSSSGIFAAGCTGLILGIFLTVGVEVALVMMGVHAVVDSLEGLSTTEDPAGIIDINNINAYDLLQYCGTEWESRYDRIASTCAENETNERINERVYRERSLQN